jgi:hypothetical protein
LYNGFGLIGFKWAVLTDAAVHFAMDAAAKDKLAHIIHKLQ